MARMGYSGVAVDGSDAKVDVVRMMGETSDAGRRGRGRCVLDSSDLLSKYMAESSISRTMA